MNNLKYLCHNSDTYNESFSVYKKVSSIIHDLKHNDDGFSICVGVFLFSALFTFLFYIFNIIEGNFVFLFFICAFCLFSCLTLFLAFWIEKLFKKTFTNKMNKKYKFSSLLFNDYIILRPWRRNHYLNKIQNEVNKLDFEDFKKIHNMVDPIEKKSKYFIHNEPIKHFHEIALYYLKKSTKQEIKNITYEEIRNLIKHFSEDNKILFTENLKNKLQQNEDITQSDLLNSNLKEISDLQTIKNNKIIREI